MRHSFDLRCESVTYVYVQTDAYMCAHAHPYVCTHADSPDTVICHIMSQANDILPCLPHARAHTLTYIHICIHTCTHTHAYTHICTHTQTHTQTVDPCACNCVCVCLSVCLKRLYIYGVHMYHTECHATGGQSLYIRMYNFYEINCSYI